MSKNFEPQLFMDTYREAILPNLGDITDSPRERMCWAMFALARQIRQVENTPLAEADVFPERSKGDTGKLVEAYEQFRIIVMIDLQEDLPSSWG